MRHCDLLRDPEGRATFGDFLVAVSLERRSILTVNKTPSGNNELLTSFVAISAHGLNKRTKGVGTLVNPDLK